MQHDDIQDLRGEVQLLSNFESPYILNYLECYEQKGSNVYIVTEQITGGDLKDALVRKDEIYEDDIANYILQIARALNHCH